MTTVANDQTPQKRSIHCVGPFVLGKTLGEGTTGKVKVGFHKGSGFKVAVKIIRKDMLLSKPSVKAKVQREIVVMKLLNHPNVMKLYDVYETSKNLFLISELVEGGELFDYIVKRRTISHEESRRIFREIIAGVDYLHSHGVCHRDLKPENIMLDQDKHVKIVDLGMSAIMRKGELLATSCGSPHYASPQVVSGEHYDGKGADIWSCGVILFALMTSNLPFDDDNIRNLLQKVRRGFFKIPSFITGDIRDLISQMIVVDPRKRITMEGIKKHPWITGVNSPEGPLAPLGDSVMDLDEKPLSANDLDQEVLSTMECLLVGNRQELEKELTSQKASQLRTYYYTLLEQKLHPPSDIYEKPTIIPSPQPSNVTSNNATEPPARTRAVSVSTPKRSRGSSAAPPPVILGPVQQAPSPAATATAAPTPIASSSSAEPPKFAVPSAPHAHVNRPVAATVQTHRRGRSVSSDPSRIPDARALALRLQQQQASINTQFSPAYAAAVAAATNKMLASSAPGTTPASVGTSTKVGTPGSGSPAPVETAPTKSAPTERVRGNSVVVRRPVAPPTVPPAQPTSSHKRQGSIVEESGAVPKRSFFLSIFRHKSSSSSSSSTSTAGPVASVHIVPENEASNYEIRIRKAEVIVRRLLEEFFVLANVQGTTSPIGFRCVHVSSLDFTTSCNFIVWVEDETIPGNPPSMYVQFLLSHGSCALFNQVCRRACEFFDNA